MRLSRPQAQESPPAGVAAATNPPKVMKPLWAEQMAQMTTILLTASAGTGSTHSEPSQAITHDNPGLRR